MELGLIRMIRWNHGNVQERQIQTVKKKKVLIFQPNVGTCIITVKKTYENTKLKCSTKLNCQRINVKSESMIINSSKNPSLILNSNEMKTTHGKCEMNMGENRSHLYNPQIIYTDEKLHKCIHCGKCFSQKSQ